MSIDHLQKQVSDLQRDTAELKSALAKQSKPETITKIVTTILAFAAIVLGLIQYRWTTQNEFRKTFWEKQFGLYKEACASAAAIAKADDIEDVKTERLRFWLLYWGELSMVEHPEVKDAMVNFGNQLYSVEAGEANPSSLLQLSYKLARSCRMSLKKSWNPVDIGDIPEQKEGSAQ